MDKLIFIDYSTFSHSEQMTAILVLGLCTLILLCNIIGGMLLIYRHFVGPTNSEKKFPLVGITLLLYVLVALLSYDLTNISCLLKACGILA